MIGCHLVQGRVCPVCRSLVTEERVESARAGAALFGAVPYAVCAGCAQEVPGHRDRNYRARWRRRAASRSVDLRRSLGDLMSSWGADTGSGLPVYAVGSYYYGGHTYPDRAMVERAIAAVEADVPRAEAGANGWTRAEAEELRLIARGLRHFLALDYPRGAP